MGDPHKSQVNEMLALILNKVKALDEVLGEIKLGISQLIHTILSHALATKYLEAHFLALSVEMHNSTRANGQSCIYITTGTSKLYEINTAIETPLFGANEEWGQGNDEAEVELK